MKPARPDREPDLVVVVLGTAKTAGSKAAKVITKWDAEKGRRVPVIDPVTQMPKLRTEDSSGEPGKAWRNDVRNAGHEAMADAELAMFVEVPLWADFTFYRGPAGPISKRTNEPTDGARLYPWKAPDKTKLLRAAEDALTGIVWKNDAQIVGGEDMKVYEAPERLEVRVWRLPATYGELRAESQASLALTASP